MELTQRKIEKKKKKDEELFQIKKEIKNSKTEVEDDLSNADEVSAKLIELEVRSRRNNLQIDGIKEEPYQTWKVYEKKFQNITVDKLGRVTKKLIDAT